MENFKMSDAMQSKQTLKQIVDSFLKDSICVRVEGGYKGLDFKTVKEKAAFAQYKAKDGWKKHPHQYRISGKTLNEVYEAFKTWKTSKKFSNFDELYSSVETLIGSISGVGPLMVYDTTLRFAEYYGLKPDLVYLHAGAHEGAVCLVNAGLMKMPLNSKMSVSDFPKDLQKLKAKDIEIILCARKKELAALSGK